MEMAVVLLTRVVGIIVFLLAPLHAGGWVGR